MADILNIICSFCLKKSFQVEIITLDACNHIICRDCFVKSMDECRSFRCPSDTEKSTNVTIINSASNIKTAMSYCNFKSIVCDNCIDKSIADNALEECFNVLIRAKSFKVYKEIKYEFLKDLSTLFDFKYPVDSSLQHLLKNYELRILKRMDSTFHNENNSPTMNKVRNIVNNLKCQGHFVESPILERKLDISMKLTEFFHNLNNNHLFMHLNPFHFQNKFSFTRFYGPQYFRHYLERYEEDFVQFQKVMHFPTAMLLSQTRSNSEHYRKLYPFMFKDTGLKCLVCMNEINGLKYGHIDFCCHKICETCISKYLITKAKCPIDGQRIVDIIINQSETTALNYLQLQPHLFDDSFSRLEEIIFDTVKHIHTIIPKAEKIWRNVCKLFSIADQIRRPKVIQYNDTFCYGKKVDELLSVVEALCYSTINDESFFQPSGFYTYYCGFCKKCSDISLNNDGYLSDPSDYQRMEETIHLYMYLYQFSFSIYNNFVDDIVCAFQHFERTDKIISDLKEHFNLDRPSHISLRQLRKDMPLVLSEQKYIDAVKGIKLELKKSKYLNHLCKNMLWY